MRATGTMLTSAALAACAAGAAGFTMRAVARERRNALAELEKSGDERTAHTATIARILQSWHDGQITTQRKRDLIAEENLFFYGREKRSPSIGTSLTSSKASEEPAGRPAQRVPAAKDDPWGDEEKKDEWWQK
jgi:hypothetical protein